MCVLCVCVVCVRVYVCLCVSTYRYSSLRATHSVRVLWSSSKHTVRVSRCPCMREAMRRTQPRYADIHTRALTNTRTHTHTHTHTLMFLRTDIWRRRHIHRCFHVSVGAGAAVRIVHMCVSCVYVCVCVSQVAAEAIKQAEREGRDVVLVDTAGRMQVRTHTRTRTHTEEQTLHGLGSEWCAHWREPQPVHNPIC